MISPYVRLYNVTCSLWARLRIHDRWKPTAAYSVLNKIDRYSRDADRVHFIQIGANDGQIDPIHAFIIRDNWSGILVEPQRDVFEKQLKRTYGGRPGIILENVAIADRTGTRSLYRIAFSSARWATGLASFLRSGVEKHIDSGRVARRAAKEGVALPESRDDYIATEEVQCLTFSDLVRKHDVTHVDIVVIDTEGYDYEIIKLIDLAAFRPEIVMFEHKHLSADDYRACGTLLRSHGYSLYASGSDTMALSQAADAQLRYV
jgi:FkbM family methyltransferase